MENTFKSSVFGGFNRDDVIRYIEKTSLESKQQIEALEQESDGLCRENAELRDKLAAAERERDNGGERRVAQLSQQRAECQIHENPPCDGIVVPHRKIYVKCPSKSPADEKTEE